MKFEYPPCCPDGRVVNQCAGRLYRERVEGVYQLHGEWTGWKLQGNKLIGPNGLRFTPSTLRNVWARVAREESDGGASA